MNTGFDSILAIVIFCIGRDGGEKGEGKDGGKNNKEGGDEGKEDDGNSPHPNLCLLQFSQFAKSIVSHS